MNYYKSQSGEVFAYDDEQVQSGWVREGLVLMTPQEVILHLNPPVPTLPLPTEISMRQARLALLQEGLLSQVDTAIAGLPEAQRLAAEIEWEYATTVKRGSPLVLAIASALELTEENLDQLFLTAVTL